MAGGFQAFAFCALATAISVYTAWPVNYEKLNHDGYPKKLGNGTPVVRSRLQEWVFGTSGQE